MTIRPQDFLGDITSQLEQWITHATQTGEPALLPAGRWVSERPLRVLLDAQNAPLGATFFGEGVARSILDLRTVRGDVPLLFGCSAAPGDNHYMSFKEIGVQGDYNGPLLQIGKDDFSDPVNEPKFDVLVQNFSMSGVAEAIRLNYVLNGDLRFVANTAGPGVALQCRQLEFSDVRGSFSSIRGMGLNFKDGFNTGNVFTAPDIENVFCCLRIENESTVSNTFIGGTYSYSSSGVFATAGKSNMIINPQANPVLPATAAGFRAYMTGVTILGGNA